MQSPKLLPLLLPHADMTQGLGPCLSILLTHSQCAGLLHPSGLGILASENPHSSNYRTIHNLYDAPIPGGPLTTRQLAEYSWMSGNPTPLMKIEQSLLCTWNSTQNTTCPNHMATCHNILQRPHWVHIRIKMSKMATGAYALILTKYIPTNYITWFKS